MSCSALPGGTRGVTGSWCTDIGFIREGVVITANTARFCLSFISTLAYAIFERG